MNSLALLTENVDVSVLSNFATPAMARYYYEINSRDDVDKLSIIMDFAKEKNLKTLFIGAGTNMLFAFDTYEGIIIKNNLSGWNYDSETKILETFSNVLISEIAEKLENDYGQNLWHRFIGLPGSIGGAVYGNAGCFGLEAENNFIEAEVYNFESRQLDKLSKIDMNFSYRSSLLKDKGIYFLVSAKFDLSKKIEKYHSDVDNLHFREHKQPKGNTCGSFFKNPNREQSAGFLIESVGLKGFNLGGAYFSEKHANFLMNDGTAKYKDLLDLISMAQEKVKTKHNINLINEVRIITN